MTPLLASSIDSLFIQIALGLFILGVCAFCLKQVANILERQNRILDLEESLRLQDSERPGSGNRH